MPVTITSVKGIGGNPPTSIQANGTATVCERVRVTSPCSRDVLEVEVKDGVWDATLKNISCACGDAITVEAVCIIGAPDGDTWTKTLPCGDCPQITVTAGAPGACVNGKRAVTITVGLTTPLVSAGAFVLDYGDGTTGAGFSLQSGTVSYQHNYPAGTTSTGYTVVVSIILPSGCPAVTTSVQVPPCTPCCPTLALQPPVVTDCATAAPPQATFVATVTAPPNCLAPAIFNWTITDQTSGQQWFRSGGTSLDTTTGWVTGGGPAGSVNLGGGNFAVAVVAAGVDPACTMAVATRSFQVRRQCPSITGPIAVIPQGDGCNFAFAVPIDNPCNLPLTYEWRFHDTLTPMPSSAAQVNHQYAAGTAISGPVQVTVSAPDCTPQVASVQVSPGCASGMTPPADPPPTTPPPLTPSMSIGCWVLLIAALVLAVVATVLGIVAVCASNPYVGIAAGIVGVVALGLLVLWLIFCARSGCPVLITLIDIVTIIVVVVGPLVGVLMAIFGTPICGVLAGLVTSGYWGTILGILVFAARALGCLRAP